MKLMRDIKGRSKVLLLAAIWTMLLSSTSLAQSWRGVVPIESTCKDVERLFESTACDKQSISRISTEETVTIVFAKDGCNLKSQTERFNVQSGTVINILVIPRYPRRLFVSDLNIDKSKFQKKQAGDTLGVFEYTSFEMGMRFSASKKGQILDISYFPSSKYDNLRCP